MGEKRECGECSLCCKLEKMPDFKEKGVWCEHCSVGAGCRIYSSSSRPSVCEEFKCVWLVDSSLPDDLRPDRVHLYGIKGDGYYKVCVDPSYPDAWKNEGAVVVGHLQSRGHVVVQVHNDQLNFLTGKNMATPERVLLDWHM